MLTASHNPPTDNGIKLFADGVEYDGDAEREIDDRVASERSRLARWDEWGESERLAVLDRYLDAVEDYIRERFGNRTPNPEDAPPDEPLAGLRIAVDCGNGVGALATPQVLERLGADIVAINASVDGHFPGRESKPTPETLSEFTAFLDDGSFDLGLAHDGDADRLVVLGPDGSVIHEDTVLAVVAARYTADSDADDPVVVTTPNASARIDERVRAAGGRVERVRLGSLHEGIARERSRGGEDTPSSSSPPNPGTHPHRLRRLDRRRGQCRGRRGARRRRRRYRSTPGPRYRTPLPKGQHRVPGRGQSRRDDRPRDRAPRGVSGGDGRHGLRRPPRVRGRVVAARSTERNGPYVRLYAESDSVDALVDDARSVIETAVEKRR